MFRSIEELLSKTRKQIFNENFGSSLSKLKSQGYDFAEVSPYVLGEDARRIDWKSTARTGKPHMKLFFEEREVNIVLCALMNGSLLFNTKKDLLLEICSLIGYSSIKTTNSLMPIILCADELTVFPKSKKLSTNEHFIKNLSSLELFKKEIDLKNISKLLHHKIKRKSFIILVGDFLGDIDLSLLASRHEILLVIVRDEFEENPKILEDVELADPESGEISDLYFGKKARDAYAKSYAKNDQKLYNHLNSSGISYMKITTGDNPFVKLFGFYRS